MERFKEWAAEINEQLKGGEFRIGHRYGYYANDGKIQGGLNEL